MVIYLGSLVQLCCGEGGELQTNITGMFGECLQFLGHIRFAPTHRVCAFPVYTAQAPGCSAGDLSKVGPGLCPLPRPKPLRFRFSGTSQSHRLGWVCVLCPFQVQAAEVNRCLASAVSPGVAVCLITSLLWLLSFPGVQQGQPLSGVPCVSSGELISGCEPPGGYQPSRFPGKLG